MSQAPEDPQGSGDAGPGFDSAEFVEESASPPPEAEPPKYRALSYDELLSLPEPEWIVEEFLKPEDLCMFYGAAGAGKTFAVIDLLACLLKGSGFYADKLAVLKPCKVLYISTEGRAKIPARFRAALSQYGITPSPEWLRVILNDMPNLGIWDTLQTMLLDLQRQMFVPDIIVYDTFARATSGQEENPSDAAKVHIENLERMRDELLKLGSHAVQIFLHHEARATGKARGSTVYEGAADLIMRFRKEDSAHVMSFEKTKDADSIEPQEFTLSKHEQGSAFVKWEGTFTKQGTSKSASTPAETAAEQAFLNHAAGPGQAKTLSGISLKAKGDDSLRKALERLVKKHPERFGSDSRITYGPGAKPNRAALHYWLKSDDEQD